MLLQVHDIVYIDITYAVYIHRLCEYDAYSLHIIYMYMNITGLAFLTNIN